MMNSSKKVFVLGEINIDLIMSSKEINPEWNKEKLVDSFDMSLGSSSAITASCLAGLGLDVYFVGIVGNDIFGEFCLKELKKYGVDTTYVVVDPQIKTGVTLSLSTEKDRALLTYLGGINELTPKLIPNVVFNEGKHIHFGSYFLQTKMIPHWKEIFVKAHENEISTSFDTGWDPNGNWYTKQIFDLLTVTDLFIPSIEEIKQIFSFKSLEEGLVNLPPSHGFIAIKRGKEGANLINEKNECIYSESYQLTPIDTTGAGDAFNAGLIYSYLDGIRGKEMLEFANACGAIATQRIGGAGNLSSLEEIKVFQLSYLKKNKSNGLFLKTNE